jgi:RHS repeat-associated protein
VISEENQSSATSDGSFLALYVHDPGKVVRSILARGFMFGNFYLAQYYQDQIGSTRMIRNHNNQLNNLYEYDPYGNALTTYGTESFNYYRFTGAELDKDSSNFYYFPYRYYAPALQRWMIRDPIPSRNVYAHVGNNPINRRDPLGLFFNNPEGDYQYSPMTCDEFVAGLIPWSHAQILVSYFGDDYDMGWHCWMACMVEACTSVPGNLWQHLYELTHEGSYKDTASDNCAANLGVEAARYYFDCGTYCRDQRPAIESECCEENFSEPERPTLTDWQITQLTGGII